VNKEKKTLVIKHEPYSLDLLNYEIAESFGRSNLPGNQFSGRRVRQNSAKLKQMRKRDRRLRKIGLSVVAFSS
jgi:hypothetical protein